MRFLIAALLVLVTATPLAAAGTYANFRFSQDGERVIAVGPDKTKISVWEVDNPKKRKVIDVGRKVEFVTSPNAAGLILVTSRRGGKRDYQVFDVASTKRLSAFTRAGDNPWLAEGDLMLSGDGKDVYVIETEPKDAVVSLRAEDGEESGRWKIDLGTFNQPTLLDTSRMFAADVFVSFHVVNFRKGTEIVKKFERCLSDEYWLSRFGDRLLVRCEQNFIHRFFFIDLRTGKDLAELFPAFPASAFHLSSGGRVLIEDRADYLYMWSTSTAKRIGGFLHPGTKWRFVAASDEVALFSFDKTAYSLVNLLDGSPIGELSTD